MENNSLIQGTNWHWRKTYIRLPIHSYDRVSGTIQVSELCLAVDNSEKTKQLMDEIGRQKIRIQKKEVHLASEHFPEGATILCVRKPNEKIEDNPDDFLEIEQNLSKLKNYIYQNGGKIEGEKTPIPVKKFSLFNFLTGGRK